MGSSSSKEPKDNKKIPHSPKPASPNESPPATGKAPAKGSLPRATKEPSKEENKTSSTDYEKRLRRFYTHYCPEKLPNVSPLLLEWKGREEILVKGLLERYGPEPSANTEAKTSSKKTSDIRPPSTSRTPPATSDLHAAGVENPWEARFARFLLAYTPNKMHTLERVVSQSKGRETTILQSLIQQKGPEPEGPLPEGTCEDVLEVVVPPNETPDASTAEEVKRKSPAPDATIASAQPEEMQETHTKEEVLSKPNVDPSTPAAAADGSPPMVRRSLRSRLSLFLGVRVPGKHDTLEECLRRYGDDEAELFHFLRETYGADPTEAEGRGYFVRRLETFYAQHDPSRVEAAAAEVDAHIGAEEEYLQSVESNEDSTAPSPSQRRHRSFKLFDYEDAEKTGSDANTPSKDETAKETMALPSANVDEKDAPNTPRESLAVCSPKPETDAAPCADADPATKGEVAVLEKGSEVEQFRHLVEDQQRQLKELQAEIDRLRTILSGDTTRRESDSRRFSSSLHGMRRASHRTHDDDAPFVQNEAIEDFLPPPPFFRPSQVASAPRSDAKAPSSFVARRLWSVSARPVRTLAEMRAEYEREREAIRSAESQLDPYHTLL